MGSTPRGEQGGRQSRTPGRNFASTDPERQREVEATPRPASARGPTPDGAAPRGGRGTAAVRRASGAASRVSPQQDSDDEGGSGRRSR